MRKKERCALIYETLDRAYPEAECTLNFASAWQLLVAAILAAQCTDERVNIVTAPLFRERPTVEDYLALTQAEMEAYIRTCGLFRNKAKNILAAARTLVDDFAGEVPQEMDELLRIPGVGRKIANLLRGDYFGVGGVVVDTHCGRIARLLGLAEGERPEQVERELRPLLPLERQSRFGHLMVHHGRVCCQAGHRHCARCPVQQLCRYGRSKAKAIAAAVAEGALDACF